MRWVLIVAGVVLLLIGAVWTLQGLNVLLGSFMTGQPLWAVIGIICLVIGSGLCYAGWRRVPR